MNYGLYESGAEKGNPPDFEGPFEEVQCQVVLEGTSSFGNRFDHPQG